MSKRSYIVHFMHADKFIDPFIDLIEHHFDSSRHHYLVRETVWFSVKDRANITRLPETVGFVGKVLFYLRHLRSTDKIILHGLFHVELILALALKPWILKNCYWIVWGGDIYRQDQSSAINLKKRFLSALYGFVARRMGYFVTHVRGDYEWIRRRYGARGQWRESFVYLSNIYDHHPVPARDDDYTNLLVGNSATKTNRHFEIFDALAPLMHEKVRIYCPLSYSDKEYAALVAAKGRSMFGDQFVALMDFMPYDEYLGVLARTDIAIFAHKRQQAMGNVINLLGMGKKVYMRRDTSGWRVFNDLSIKLYDFDALDLKKISADVAADNRNKIIHYFSEKNLVSQLRLIFDEKLAS